MTKGDHAAVLRCWDVLKELEQAPTIPLSQIVRSMRFYKKDIQVIANELRTFFQKHPDECNMAAINDILENSCEEFDPEDFTYSLLIKAIMHRPLEARGIVKELLSCGPSEFSQDLALSVLDLCSATSDAVIAEQLYEKMKRKPMNILVAFIWFYIGVEQFGKACDVYELDMQHDDDITLDASLRESIIDSAVLCGRIHLAERLIPAPSPSHFKQLVEGIGVILARWNAMICYWVVLVF